MHDESDTSEHGQNRKPSQELAIAPKPPGARFGQELQSFLVQIVIVIVGVLLALLANEAVDDYQWSQKIASIRMFMQDELAADDGPQAYGVVARYFCRMNQLNKLDDAVAGHNHGDIKQLADRYAFPPITWDDDGWQMIRAADVASHISPREVSLWSVPYSWIQQLQSVQPQERDDIFELRDLAAAFDGNLSQDRQSMKRAIQRLRNDNDMLTSYATLTVWGVTHAKHLKLDDETNQISIMRRYYGNCVIEPDLSRMKWENAPVDIRAILAWLK